MEKVNEFEREFLPGNQVRYLFRGPNLDWGVIYLKPGEQMGEHYHEEVEETFYFAEGGGTITIDGVPHKARQGDAYRLLATEKHALANDTDQPLKLVFLKYPYRPKDRVNTGK